MLYKCFVFAGVQYTLQNIFLLQNNQNRQQNKLVNMASENDLIKHNNIGHIYIWSIFSKSRFIFA